MTDSDPTSRAEVDLYPIAMAIVVLLILVAGWALAAVLRGMSP